MIAQRSLFVPEPPDDPEPKYVRHSKTSKDAAKRMKGGASARQRAAVLAAIATAGANGATDQEIEIRHDIAGNSVRPRRRELEKQGFVKDSGRTRPTTSGRSAVVWVAREFAPAT